MALRAYHGLGIGSAVQQCPKGTIPTSAGCVPGVKGPGGTLRCPAGQYMTRSNTCRPLRPGVQVPGTVIPGGSGAMPAPSLPACRFGESPWGPGRGGIRRCIPMPCDPPMMKKGDICYPPATSQLIVNPPATSVFPPVTDVQPLTQETRKASSPALALAIVAGGFWLLSRV